jgi:MFS family permease
MQVPAGMLLDKFGAKRLIVFGSLFTGLGNLVVAISPELYLAVAGRAVVGFGDAFIFISMIRLINGWVSGSGATIYTQLFANLGQLGQLGSAVPFAYLLGVAGWAPAFTAISSLAFLAAALATLLIRDDAASSSESWKTGAGVIALLARNLRDPHTRKAFWVHFTLQSSGSVFILLWGYPFLVQGEGLEISLATSLLGSFVFIGFIIGPIISHLCIRFPERRHVLVTVIYSLMVLAWLLIFLTPGRNPLWQLVFLVLAIGVGGPASMIAFDYSRTSISKSRLGSANGVINSGGFVATFVSMFLIGLAIDLIRDLGVADGGTIYSLDAFKLALPLQLVVMSTGLVFFFRARRAALLSGNKSAAH